MGQFKMSEFSLNVGDNIEILAGEFPVRKLSKETYERWYRYEVTDGEQPMKILDWWTFRARSFNTNKISPMRVEQERIRKCKKET